MQKKSLIILAGVVGLFVVGSGTMFLFNVCPPQGPWPMPPWCGESAFVIPSIPSEEVNAPAPEVLPAAPSMLSRVVSKIATTVSSVSSKVQTQVRTLAPATTPTIATPTPATSTPIPKLGAPVSGSITVTVPYWTGGDVYLGTADNPKLQKLDRANDVIYTATVSLPKNSPYFYSYATPDAAVKEAPVSRSFSGGRMLDFVSDWEGAPKQLAIAGDFQKSFNIGACLTCGVSYTKGNFIEPIKQTMDQIKKEGGTWVNFVNVWFVTPDYRGNEVKPIYAEDFKGTSGWIGATIKDQDLITLIREAHARGLKVYLSPHVAPEDWGPGVPGKGDLEPADPAAFFASYKTYIDHYADIAQQTGVEMYAVGNEMDTLTETDIAKNTQIDRTAAWRDVIKSARQHYNGLLTYSVSCMNEQRCGPQLIKFWDALDVIGWEWYVPIASGPHEPIASMKANAERIIRNNIKPLYDTYKKPVVLTEVGWEAYPGACANTYGTGPGKGGDRTEQASCYEALFQALEGKQYIKGMHIWEWTASLPGKTFDWVWTDSANEVRFSITEQEIQKWYGKIR